MKIKRHTFHPWSVAAALTLALALCWPSTAFAGTEPAGPITNQTHVTPFRCNTLGVVNGSEGRHCVALASIVSASGTEVWAVGQANCQVAGGGAVRQCAGIRQNVGVWKAGQSKPLIIRQVNCGVWGGSGCPTGVWQNGSGHYFIPETDLPCAEVWAAVTDDIINVPGNVITGPGPNVASTHSCF